MSRPALAMRRPQSQAFGAARQQQAAVRRASLVVRADNEPRVTKEYREGEDSVRVPSAPAGSSSEQPAAGNPNSQYVDELSEVSWVDGRLPRGWACTPWPTQLLCKGPVKRVADVRRAGVPSPGCAAAAARAVRCDEEADAGRVLRLRRLPQTGAPALLLTCLALCWRRHSAPAPLCC